MPEYLSPGVYVEEVDAGPKPIAGVSTSTAGAVGVTVRGPTSGLPVLVTSFQDYVRRFGGVLPDPPAAQQAAWGVQNAEGGHWWKFPLAVKGFFDNGGQRLYVKRVAPSAATSATATLGKGLVAHVVADAAATATQLKLGHLFELENTTAVTLVNGDTLQQIGPNFTVASYDAAGSTITLNAAVGAPVLASRGDFVQIHPRSIAAIPANERTLVFTAKARGAWGNDLSVRTRPVVEAVLSLLPHPANGGAAASAVVQSTAGSTVTVNDATGFANGDVVLINGRSYTLSNVNQGADTFDVAPAIPAAANWAGAAVRRRRRANDAASDEVHVAGVTQLYDGALVELDSGTTKELLTVVSTNGETVKLSGAPAGTYFDGDRMRLIAISIDVTYAPSGTVEAAEVLGPYRFVNDGSSSYVVTGVNLNSKLVDVATGAGFSSAALTTFPTTVTAGPATFGNGHDQLATLRIEDFIGQDPSSGINSLELIDEIAIVAAPGMWSRTVQSALIMHCETLKDRFAVLDPPDGLDVEGIRAFREPLSTKYAALYHPWLVVRNPATGRNVNVAPSAHMAGIYAGNDVARGVHKAPANIVIQGITQIAQIVTKREQDMLNPLGINVLRAFPNLGPRVWGARTLTLDQSWKYINVRRLFLFVGESIDEGTQWVVFEPNDEPLWARVRQSVTNFLTTVWRSGALQGATPEEAFFVTCDRTTMTQDDIDNGRLICVIGIAPVKPAEFVIFRIQQFTSEAQS